MRRFARYAWIVFLVFAVLAFLFGVYPGTWVADEGVEPTDSDTSWLLTTYAAVTVVLTVAIALTAFRRGERWAWWAFWAWPVFFGVHGLVFWPGDFVFAALGVAALLLTAPGRSADRAAHS